MKHLLFTMSFLVFAHHLYSQNFDITYNLNSEIGVCDNAVSFGVTVKNAGTVLATSPTITIALPSGIAYEQGSFTETTTHGLTAVNTSSNNNLQFACNTLSPGDSITFALEYIAETDAIALQNQGVIFRNLIVATSNGISDTLETDSYNILYPVISVPSITPSAQTILSGASSSRDIHIINGGNGRTNQLIITDIKNSPSLTITSVSMGTISGDSIILSGSDFSTVGNGDEYLDQNESFVLSETFSGTSCSNETVTSTLKTLWGCDGNNVASVDNYANVSIQYKTPSVKLIANASFDACFGSGEASPQQLKIVNKGNGVGTSFQVDIYKSTGGNYNQNIFSHFDAASLQVRIGENGTVFTPNNINTFSTNNSGTYACLGANPIGRIQFELPNLSPGDTVLVNWDMYSCCITSCSNDAVKGWKAEVDYSDACQTYSYNKSITGQNENEQLISFFTEAPADINTYQNETFSFIVSSFKNTLPVGNQAQYEAKFTLDPGLTYESLSFHSNGTVWTPDAVSYDTISNTVVAVFPENAPFTIPKSTIDLTLSGTCGTEGWKTIALDFYYNPDNSCTTGCSIPLGCDITTTTYVHCPGAVCNSLNVLDFTIERISFGLPDNNVDGFADSNGSLDFSKIKTNRAMVGDTLRAEITSVVGTTPETWDFAQLITNVDYGSVLEVIDATVYIYDASTASFFTIPNAVHSSISNGNAKAFTFDLSTASLSSLNNALNGYSYAENDSLSVSVRYHVVESVQNLIKETTVTNELFLSQYANPTTAQKEYCNFKNDRITLIGYQWRNDNSNNFTAKSCTRTIHQYFGLSIGDTPSNYAGGNLFPFEYRNWGVIQDAHVVIPPNYSHVSTQIKWYRTKRTNATITQTLNGLVPDAINGNTLIYDLKQYFDNGTLKLGDDGFHGKITVELAPNCDVPENTYQNIDWSFNYKKTEAIDGAESGNISANNPDKIRFQRPQLDIQTDNPWQDANQRAVIWDYKLYNNSSSGAQNAWIHIVPPSNIVIDSIKNDNTGATLTLQNDIYLAGQIAAGGTADFSIYGTFSNCDSVVLSTYAGYECTGYPTDFASFECPFEYMPLYVFPKPSAYQTRISHQLDSDPCNNQIELTLDITSTKIAHMYDMDIQLITSNEDKIRVLDGTSEFQHNISNNYVAINDPTFVNNTYQYTINNYVSAFATDGIPGVMDINNNRYRLKFMIELGPHFQNGDFLHIVINGENACSVPLPSVNLAYDPSISFAVNQNSGLSGDAVTNWSASWGDYDNDGYDDLFTPSREYGVKSILYHNNQDGTFTKVLSGPVTNDLGSSIMGTWGDYDNDGYLDLFIANNESSPNRLYHNNQDGTFTAITSGAIVEEGIYSHSAAWADYNKDGNLDIVISDFHATHFNKLLLGDGNGNFTLDESSVISQSATSAVGVAWGDYDGDGDLDLFIANTNGENNQLFRNDVGIFTPITTGSVVSDGGTSVGGVWGDYDNDGDLDLFVTNSSDTDPNFLYTNNGDGSFNRVLSGDIANDKSNSHGASWIDFDNDMDLDLIVTNDQGKQNFLYSNNGNGGFTKLINAISEATSNSYGPAWSDFDNDGDYDLFVANTNNETNEFYINEKGACTNHIGVVLKGCISNKSGIGATVRVKSTLNGISVWQTQHISTQTSALGGQNSSKLLFGLEDATSVDSLIVLWPSGIITSMAHPAINQYHEINEECGAKVCGVVFADLNTNGIQDSTEYGIPNSKVFISPGDIEAFTDANGAFVAYLADGNYTISLDSSLAWNQTSPASTYALTVDKTIQTVYCGNNFGCEPICIDPDLTVMGGATAFRRGLINDFNLVVTNNGAFDANEVITLELTMTENIILQAQNWTAQSAASGMVTYTHSFSGLAPLRDTVFALLDSVDVLSNLDDPVLINGKVSYQANECDTLNNTFSITDKVVGSIDPNDKLVFVEGKGYTPYADRNEKLIYKIRFQNIGNYAAQRVHIVDTLSDLLDWERVAIEGSSHDFTFTRSGNVLTWINNSIELPDSLSDPEGSQGFVSFSVYPKPTVSPFESITNKAAIQFDYNDPLITNTVETIILPRGNFELESMTFVYPNPSTSTINVLLLDDNGRRIQIHAVNLLSLTGQRIDQYTCNHSIVFMDVSDLSPGVYLVQTIGENREMSTAQFVKR